MMLNPLGLILTLMGRLLGIAVPQYRPPIQPPAGRDVAGRQPRGDRLTGPGTR